MLEQLDSKQESLLEDVSDEWIKNAHCGKTIIDEFSAKENIF